MANPQDLPSTQMAFTKYPELPKDIRLMIIDEAIEVTHQEYRKGSPWKPVKPYLFPLASVNYEWNRVIEMLLFNRMKITPSSLSEFAEICGKRHRRLNIIRLSIKRTEVPSGDRPEAYVGAAVAQFFNIMKDWSHMDRERQGLLEVLLKFNTILRDHPPSTSLNCDFGTLPKVPIIGALYETGMERLLHPSSSLQLYQSCPNIRHATLGLPFLDHSNQSIEQARHAVTSLASAQPDLSHLGLTACWHPSRQPHLRDAWMPAADCVAAFPPSWTNNLVELNLKNVHDLPRFFLEAGRSAWPNLKVMNLRGVVDNENKSEDEIEDTARETCAVLVQGLTKMLPGMPKITTVSIELTSTVLNSGLIILLGMRLGNPVHVDNHDWPEFYSWIQSCSYRFVPSHDSGVVLAVGTDFPGHLATELQHTVRRHQLKDLGVFCENKELSPWGNQRLFWQWNSEEQCWDAAFEEEEDEFIYQMGEYFDWTKSM